MSEAEHLRWVVQHLKEEIADPAAYVASVRGKPLKHEFTKLVRLMTDGDQLWEWEWFGKIGPRDSYSMGWCVVRKGVAVASYCYSYS